MSCHVPPKLVPPTICDIFLAIDGPPGPSMAAMDGPRLENHPGSFMMVLHALPSILQVQSLPVVFHAVR